MNDIAIRVENLGKLYHIGGPQARYKTIRESIQEGFKAPFRRAGRLLSGQAHGAAELDQTIWALKDVSFEVKQGEVVGIIGRNGAGKSTLLKILSRITEPTEGEIMLRGRVGSLLEVGTGFHPELTGRENVYLNGAILGMKREEIDRKFDGIVDFSEIEKFIDTPVKHYSSGMYVRLAFAVSAYLEPEILLVDEVLAVGDVGFQKKCLGKMENVSRIGRTVLFVSHNMAAIETLCTRSIWIEDGEIRKEGPTDRIVDAYLDLVEPSKSMRLIAKNQEVGFTVEKVLIKDEFGHSRNQFRPGESMAVEVYFKIDRPLDGPYIWIAISNRWGTIFTANMLLDGMRPNKLEQNGSLICTFEMLPLLPKQVYTVILGGRFSDGVRSLINPTEVGQFKVVGTATEIGLLGKPAETTIGASASVIVPYSWRLPDGQVIRVDPLLQVVKSDK